MTRLAKIVPAILAAVLAVALFQLGRGGNWTVLGVACTALVVLTFAFGLISCRVIRSNPRIAVWLVDTWFVGIVILNAAVILGFAAIGSQIAGVVQGSPATTDVMLKAIGGLVGTVLAAAATSFFANDGTNSIWPSAIYRSLMERSYVGRFAAGSLAHQAVFDKHVGGTDPVGNAKVDFRDWGFRARHMRARLVGHA